MMYKFQRLIRKYGVKDAYTYSFTETEGGWNEDGTYTPPSKEETETPLKCAIVPMNQRTVTESGGRYEANDRQLYTRTKLQKQQKVIYRDASYTVVDETDYTEYADFFVYAIRAVSTFDSN